jgi:hypothetical protein
MVKPVDEPVDEPEPEPVEDVEEDTATPSINLGNHSCGGSVIGGDVAKCCASEVPTEDKDDPSKRTYGTTTAKEQCEGKSGGWGGENCTVNANCSAEVAGKQIYCSVKRNDECCPSDTGTCGYCNFSGTVAAIPNACTPDCESCEELTMGSESMFRCERVPGASTCYAQYDANECPPDEPFDDCEPDIQNNLCEPGGCSWSPDGDGPVRSSCENIEPKNCGDCATCEDPTVGECVVDPDPDFCGGCRFCDTNNDPIAGAANCADDDGTPCGAPDSGCTCLGGVCDDAGGVCTASSGGF